MFALFWNDDLKEEEKKMTQKEKKNSLSALYCVLKFNKDLYFLF